MKLGINITRAKNILRLAAPVMAGMLVQTSINLTDTAMVGRLEPAESIPGVAALGFSLPLLWALGGFVCSISVGTQAITARRFGEGRMLLAGRTLTNSLTIALVAGTVFSLLGFFLSGVIFPLLHDDPDVIRLGTAFCRVRFFSILPWVATFSYKAFYDGLGRTYIHMWAAVLMTVGNFILNTVLIFGPGPYPWWLEWAQPVAVFFGAPRMGVIGAAAGSLSGTWIGLLVLVIWSMSRHYRKKFRLYRIKNLHPRLMWDIVKLSVPSGFAQVVVMAGFVLFSVIAGALDSASQAVNASATKVIIDVLSMCFIACFAFGTATATLVSQSMGAGEFEVARRYGIGSVKLATVCFGIMGIIVALNPCFFLSLFTKDAVVIQAGIAPMRIMALSMLVIPSSLIFSNALFGAGNTKFVFKVESSLHFCFLLPMSYVLGHVFGLGLAGIFIAALLYMCLSASFMGWKFRQGKWKSIHI